MQIRRAINEKAKEISDADGERIDSSRRQMENPKSKPGHNPDGLREGELLAMRKAERGLTRKYKKRTLKELPPEVRKEIVRLYNEEHQLQQDIAKDFRIQPQLVFRLVKEARSEPEKLKRLEKKRERKGRVRADAGEEHSHPERAQHRDPRERARRPGGQARGGAQRAQNGLGPRLSDGEEGDHPKQQR